MAQKLPETTAPMSAIHHATGITLKSELSFVQTMAAAKDVALAVPHTSELLLELNLMQTAPPSGGYAIATSRKII
ncbi:hypothetical protein SAMN05428948_2762 [Massilia sp. CF038]|nr:hypothetical protein SAMN05428948_2762 [Massilia sp. CF038]